MSVIWEDIWIPLGGVGGLLLSARVHLAISRLALIFVLPLDFHAEFGLLGLWSFPVLCMAVNPPNWPNVAFLSCGRLSCEWFGLESKPWPVLVLFWVCWTGRRAVIHHSAWFGSGSGASGGTCPFGLARLIRFIDSWIGFKGVVVVVVRCML